MKRLLILLFAISLQASAQNFKNSNRGDSPEQVLENEKEMVFLGEEELDRTLSGLTFIEDGPEGIFYTHTFMFYKNKFYGVRTKRAYLDGDNTFYKAYTDYNQRLEEYKANYENRLKEKAKEGEHQLKAFQIKLPERTLYVSLKKEEEDYYLMESTFSTSGNVQ